MSVTFAIGGMETSVAIPWMVAATVSYISGRRRLTGIFAALGISRARFADLGGAAAGAPARGVLAGGGVPGEPDRPAVDRAAALAKLAVVRHAPAPWFAFSWPISARCFALAQRQAGHLYRRRLERPHPPASAHRRRSWNEAWTPASSSDRALSLAIMGPVYVAPPAAPAALSDLPMAVRGYSAQ